MNKIIDTNVFLKLHQTDEGDFLYINNEKQKVVIENDKITNNLKEYQLEFLKNYING